VEATSGIRIEPAAGDDVRWAAGVMAASEPWVTLGRGFEACLAACSVPTDTLHIAWAEGARGGLVLVRPRGVAGAPYIVSIAVDPAVRSRGIGAAMLEFVEEAYRRQSRHLFLCVSSFNTRALAFYLRHGFVQVGRFHDFIIPGADELLLHKRLDPPASTRHPS